MIYTGDIVDFLRGVGVDQDWCSWGNANAVSRKFRLFIDIIIIIFIFVYLPLFVFVISFSYQWDNYNF